MEVEALVLVKGAWPEIDAEGGGIMVAPPSTGADAVVVGVAAQKGDLCWGHREAMLWQSF